MGLLLSFAALLAVLAVFGALVWLAAGIARVETMRSADDARMIAAVRRHDKQQEDGNHEA